MPNAINIEIERLIFLLKKQQSSDGSWKHPFELGITPDAFMIILLKSLEMDHDPLIDHLVKRLESKQEENGAWKLYHDEEAGNLSITIEAYYALLYSGKRKKSDPHMQKARKFIIEKGGLKKAKSFTKVLLTITGQQRWPLIFPIPLESILLPPSFPLNIFDISLYGRTHLIPILLLGHKKFQLRVSSTPDLRDLQGSREEEAWGEFRSEEARSVISRLQQGVQSLIGKPFQLRSMAEESIKKYMLGRLEEDGTFYNFFSATFFMIYALLASGYSNRDPVILKAVEGLKATACQMDSSVHVQFTTSHIWNTALVSYAMQEAGVPYHDSSITKSTKYLLSRQHFKYGDWYIHSPQAKPGGWGFSDYNTINPDIDDTTAALRAIWPSLQSVPSHQSNWDKGVSFVLAMQNEDGGFPAFEKDVDNMFIQYLPLEGNRLVLTDPSTADLTGRALELLGNFANLKKEDQRIAEAVRWLHRDQKGDGSWYGRWGICFIYGTWAALTGLQAAGESPHHPSVIKGVNWLKGIQNKDGGWGESCKSDARMKYVPLSASNLTQTAWATDALISSSPNPTPEIEKGINFLIREAENDNWTLHYPVGQGLANYIYFHYHSYRYIYPLLALSHYKNKYMR